MRQAQSSRLRVPLAGTFGLLLLPAGIFLANELLRLAVEKTFDLGDRVNSDVAIVLHGPHNHSSAVSVVKGANNFLFLQN